MYIMDILFYTILGAFVLGLVFSPRFRKVLGIRAGYLLDKSTTPTERAKYELDKLIATVTEQRGNVTRVKGKHRVAVKDLETAGAKVSERKEQYKLAKKSGGSEELLNDLSNKVIEAEADRDTKAALVAEYGNAAKEALTALESAEKKIKAAAAQISNAETKAELAQVLNATANAMREAKEIDSVTSKIGAELRKVDEDIETARANMDMAKGSTTEQEMEEIERKAKAEEARKRLDAEIAGEDASN